MTNKSGCFMCMFVSVKFFNCRAKRDRVDVGGNDLVWVWPAQLCAGDHVRPVLIIHFSRRRSILSHGQEACTRVQKGELVCPGLVKGSNMYLCNTTLLRVCPISTVQSVLKWSRTADYLLNGLCKKKVISIVFSILLSDFQNLC